MASRRSKIASGALIFLALVLAFAAWVMSGVSPTMKGKPYYIRYRKGATLHEALRDLQASGVIKNAWAAELLAPLRHHSQKVAIGTYEFWPGMHFTAVLQALSSPIRQMVRMPETNWARRSANLLEMHEVATADEYMAEVQAPVKYKSHVPFPIEGDSLEGYLFPDTYDFPPLLGAEEVVDRQLSAFNRKVWDAEKHPKNLRRALIVASLVELEVKRDEERPIVAGVIENRLAKKMPLQLDATVNYAKQKWGRLAIKELTSVKSPYNTYLNKGLPPGPICSPSIKSIEAALHPAKHDYFYYVAMPDGHQIFAKTLEDHLHNIKLRKAAIAKLAGTPTK